jgi:hypothetical protein
MRALIFILLLFSVCIAPTGLYSQDVKGSKPMSKEALDQLKAGEEALGALEELKVIFEKAMRARRYDCLQAFGHSAFCKCLCDNLAVGLDFKAYIIAVTSSKEELGYNEMSNEDKALVDSAIRVRDQCVRQLGFH